MGGISGAFLLLPFQMSILGFVERWLKLVLGAVIIVVASKYIL
jgi:hypothetical protein